MSFLKRLFNQQPATESNLQSGVIHPVMNEELKSLVFNAYGSKAYDNLLWIGKNNPKEAKLIYNGLEHISLTINLIQPAISDAVALVQQYTAHSVLNLRSAMSIPNHALRFFVNSVELNARMEHGMGVLTPVSSDDGDSIKEWLQKENATHTMATAAASLFTAPLSWALAQDPMWPQIDVSPKSRMLLWATMNTSNVFAGHLLRHLKLKFSIPRVETQEAIFVHLRLAWISYVYQMLDANRSPSERAVMDYFKILADGPEVLEVYGMHIANTLSKQLYQNDPQSANYKHFAALLRSVAPEVSDLSEKDAKDFFSRTRLLNIMAGETQWLKKIIGSDITENNANALNMNLNEQIIQVMRQPNRLEFIGFR